MKNEPTKSIDDLKEEFRDWKNLQKNKCEFSNNFVTIWDKDYFFSYVGHPIEMQEFREFTHPFENYSWINYEIQSDDEYQDLIGEDVQNNSEISSVSEDSKNSFIVSDDHLSDDEDQDRERKDIKPKINTNFANRWYFKGRAISQQAHINLEAYTMALVESKNKLPM